MQLTGVFVFSFFIFFLLSFGLFLDGNVLDCRIWRTLFLTSEVRMCICVGLFTIVCVECVLCCAVVVLFFFPSSFLIRYTTSIYFSWENEDLLFFFSFPTRKPYLDTRHFSRCPEVYVVFKVKRNRFGYQKKKRKTETDTDDSFTPKRRPWAKPRPTKPFPKTVKW